jgi:hypothetical protein
LKQALGAYGNTIKGISESHEIFSSGVGDDQALALAIEELEPELLFQCLDLVADCTLRNKQLFGRPGEALVTGRGLEGLEGIQWRKAPEHRANFMRKTQAR